MARVWIPLRRAGDEHHAVGGDIETTTCTLRLRYQGTRDPERRAWEPKMCVWKEVRPAHTTSVVVRLPQRQRWVSGDLRRYDPEPVPVIPPAAPDPIYTFTAARRRDPADIRVTIRGNVYGPAGARPHLEPIYVKRRRTRRYRLRYYGERLSSSQSAQLTLFYWADIPRYVDRIEIEVPGGEVFTIRSARR